MSLETVELKLDAAAAISRIKSSRNRKIFISANHTFESRTSPNHGYERHGCIPVSAPTAVKWIQDTVGEGERADMVWVTLAINEYCMFIR